MIEFLLALIAGIATPTQTSINNRLRQRVGSPYITSLISFSVATLCFVVLLLVNGGGLGIPFATINEHPWWIWTGGVFGVLIVVPTTIALPKIGSAKMVMLLSFGQIMTSLIVDHFGIFDALQISFGLSRALGAIVVIYGVAKIAGFSPKSGKAGGLGANASDQTGGFIYNLLPFISGIACALQVAVNGTLGAVIGDAWKAAFISMSVGTLSTAVLVVVMLVFAKKSLYDPEEYDVQLKAWMLMGGAVAFVLVGGNAVAAPVIGTGLVTIMNLVGQMGMGLVIDGVGFLGIEKQAVSKDKIIGMLAMIVGAAVITFI